MTVQQQARIEDPPLFPETKTSFSADKVRGGYYTPPEIADWLTAWAIRSPNDRVLEPSCGDGAFLVSCADYLQNLGASSGRIAKSLVGVEVVRSEAEKARSRLASSASVHCQDFFEWAREQHERRFDCVIGNPPFIRYQKFPEPSRSVAMSWMKSLGLKPNKLTNIWVPFVVVASTLLDVGGRLALVLPAELLQVSYAAQLRIFLLDRFRTIKIFACNEMLFEKAEQEVVLLLADDKVATPSARNKCRIDLAQPRIVDELLATCPSLVGNGKRKTVRHDTEKWVKYFLNSREISFLRRLRESGVGVGLGDFASVDIGVVTGRNGYFVLSKSQVAKYGIHEHTIPVLGRSAQLKGAMIDARGFDELVAKDEKVHLFHVQADANGGLTAAGKAYVMLGEKERIHQGYKCSIRKKWYCVPSVWVPHCFFFRQIYDFPRVVLNKVGATSTDTIHRMQCSVRPSLLARNLYTHLTPASAEIEGRSYGGGVLELEPSEAERTLVPAHLSENALPLKEVDRLVRAGRLDEALKANDGHVLIDGLGLSETDCAMLDRVWRKMRDRRMARRRRKAKRS